ncbi:MAG: lipopolysaccharide biosynthesis protein [Pseudomonadota bacterium]
MVALRFCIRTLSVVSTLILVRILVPDDFGLVALAMSFLAMLELATAFSFDVPLIQNPSASKSHFDSAWTMNVAMYTVLSVAVVLLAPAVGRFFDEDRLPPVLTVLAIGFWVSGFENIYTVQFRKQLNFKADVILMGSKKLIAFVVTIGLALNLRSYWALVIGTVTSNISGVVLSYIAHQSRPALSVARAREMLQFSKWLMLNNAIAYLRNRSPDIIIGRLFGTQSLGYFTVANELAMLPSTELIAPLNRAVFPGYAKLSGSNQELEASFLNTVGLIALLAVPAGAGLAAVSMPLTTFVLGSQWATSAPLIESLALAGAVTAILANNSSMYYAIGKPHIITVLGVVYVTLLLSLSLILARRVGLQGIADAYLVTAAVFAPFSMAILARIAGFSLRAMLSRIASPVVCGLTMYLLVSSASIASLVGGFPVGVQLLSLVLLGVVTYVGLIALIWLLRGKPDSAERLALEFGRARLRRG